MEGAPGLPGEFKAIGVPYTVAAKEMNLGRSTLHMALHGSQAINMKRVGPIVRAWLDARKQKTFFQTRPQSYILSKRKIALADVAASLNTPLLQLRAAVSTGQWESENDFRKFQDYLDNEDQRRKPKMLTRISLSEEVLAKFGLERDPFTSEMTTAEDIFDTKELAKAEKKIMFAVDRAGWVSITGEIGSGKSTLLKRVEARLAKRKDAILVKPRIIEKQFLGASHVCDAILQDLGTDVVLSRRTLEHKARLVGRSLEEAFRDGKKVVILIDEAHLLRDDALLALKRIYEFEIGFKKLLAIVLVGQVSLARRLKTNFLLAEVSQRVDLYEIGSLNGTLAGYITHKLERAGLGGKEIFEPAALKAIAAKGEATPLTVNNIAAAAMLAAWDLGETKVTATIIKQL